MTKDEQVQAQKKRKTDTAEADPHDYSHCGQATRAIHAGRFEDPYGSATVPIYQSSTFSFPNAETGASRFKGLATGERDGFIYTRLGNPTIRALEDLLASLEGGHRALACASGMGAVNTMYFALLGAGAHMIGSSAMYGPSRMVMEKMWKNFNIEYSFVDTSVLENIKKELKPNTKLIFIETPTNPTLSVSDIKAVAELAHAHGCVLAVDNTFMSPILQNPLALGADIVMHSMTKWINGHTDVVGGCLIVKDDVMFNKLFPFFSNMGANMDPHQAWLCIRGIQTLEMRVHKAQQNAHKVAAALEGHKAVNWIKYVGLKSHPQYELSQKQCSGSGALMSIELKGGYDAGVKLLNNVHIFTLAVSLGGVESLIQHPASMTHAGMPRDMRIAADITDGLVRISVGCEDAEDLIKDLTNALALVQ